MYHLVCYAYKKRRPKTPFRGRWRIRTAVQGFADLCLATRPTDHFSYEWNAKLHFFNFLPNLAQKSLLLF